MIGGAQPEVSCQSWCRRPLSSLDYETDMFDVWSMSHLPIWRGRGLWAVLQPATRGPLSYLYIQWTNTRNISTEDDHLGDKTCSTCFAVVTQTYSCERFNYSGVQAGTGCFISSWLLRWQKYIYIYPFRIMLPEEKQSFSSVSGLSPYMLEYRDKRQRHKVKLDWVCFTGNTYRSDRLAAVSI